MPELPEVETVRRGLERRLVGDRIVAVEVYEPRLRIRIDRKALARLIGRRIEGIGRRAKYLVVDVGDGLAWLVHLGMSGRVVIGTGGGPRGRHEHVRVSFEGGAVLSYSDPRRFGLMRVGHVEHWRELRALGPEPLGAEFDGAVLHARIGRSRREIKTALLDQRAVAGIGNIYANEILFRAGVRPTRRCHRLRRAELDRIAAATREVLAEAVERRGTSFSDYFDSEGIPGTYQDVLSVFDRPGEACRRCGLPVRRRTQGGRSSFYCPRCQR